MLSFMPNGCSFVVNFLKVADLSVFSLMTLIKILTSFLIRLFSSSIVSIVHSASQNSRDLFESLLRRLLGFVWETPHRATVPELDLETLSELPRAETVVPAGY